MIQAQYRVYDKDEVSQEVLDSLTLRNPEFLNAVRLGFSTYKIPKLLYLYREEGDKIFIPRCADIPEELANAPVTEDLRSEGKHCTFHSRIVPKDYQVEAIEVLANTENGILQAGCGRGKTIMCLAAMAKVGVKTLIIVNKEFLLEQWKDRIAEFLGEEVGVIQAEDCDYSHNITLAMVQSLSCREYPEELYKEFGLVVTDEVHRIGSKEWCQVVPKFYAKRRWGLSATPNRADGMEIMFKAHIGDVAYVVEGIEIKPTVSVVTTNTMVDVNRIFSPATGQVSTPLLSTALSKDTDRTVQILAVLHRALEAGRKVLVLGERLDQLKEMVTLVDRKYKAMLYIGATPKEERAKAGEYDVIFGSMSLAKEALDIPELDTEFLISPVSSEITVQQACGRITRECEDKKPPMVVDFLDTHIGVCHGLFKRRKKVYDKLGYEVFDSKGNRL